MKLVQYRNKRYVLLWSPKQEALRYASLTGSSDGTRGAMLPCKGRLYLVVYNEYTLEDSDEKREY